MDKIFKAYVNLIENSHKTYYEKVNDSEQNADIRISQLKSSLEAKLFQRTAE